MGEKQPSAARVSHEEITANVIRGTAIEIAFRSRNIEEVAFKIALPRSAHYKGECRSRGIRLASIL